MPLTPPRPLLSPALLLMGAVGGAHGVKGLLRVKADPAAADSFNEAGRVFVGDSKTEAAEYRVERSVPIKRGVLLALSGVTDRNQAEALTGASVFVLRDDLAPLETDEHYFADLIGLEVETEDGRPVGRVERVFNAGAADVYVIVPGLDGADELMVPATEYHVLAIDLEAGRMIIRPPVTS